MPRTVQTKNGRETLVPLSKARKTLEDAGYVVSDVRKSTRYSHVKEVSGVRTVMAWRWYWPFRVRVCESRVVLADTHL